MEVDHWKLDDLSLTWNTIDPVRPVRWPGFDLAWRREPLPALRTLGGDVLRGVELRAVEGANDLALGSVDVRFVFDAGTVTVCNALDENGLSFD